jgi:nitrate reductase beta subunit
MVKTTKKSTRKSTRKYSKNKTKPRRSRTSKKTKSKSKTKRKTKKRSRVQLPKLGDEYHLSDYGYKLSKSEADRRKALTKASKSVGTLPVLRRLNLARNYSKNVPNNHKRYTQDVEYMKRKYKREKSKH